MNSEIAETRSRLDPGRIGGPFASILCIAFVVNLLRNLSTELPHQLGDEAVFLLTAKFFPDTEPVRALGYTPYPGLVFLKIGSLFAASDHFYRWIKVWNAACFTLAAIPAYAVARSVLGGRDGAIAALALVIAPATIYGTYFTPEATYILAFWVFSSFAIRALCCPRQWSVVAAAGAMCAVAYLIKPHGVGLAVAYVAAALILTIVDKVRRPNGGAIRDAHEAPADGNGERKPEKSRGDSTGNPLPLGKWSFGTSWRNVATFALAAIVTLAVLGKALGGDWLSWLDLALYSNLVDGTADRLLPFNKAVAIAVLFLLHVAGIIAALAIPLVLAGTFGSARLSTPRALVVHWTYSLAIVAVLVAMTAKASVDFHVIYGGSNTLDRLNERYYTFAIPLLLFGLAAALQPNKGNSLRGVLASAVMAIVIAGCAYLVSTKSFTFVDAPDFAYLLSRKGRVIAVVSAVMIVALYAALPKLPLRRTLIAGWMLMALADMEVATALQQNEERVQTGDRAVQVLRGLFAGPDLNRGLIVINGEPVGAARVTFQLASRSSVVATVDDAASRKAGDTQWILVLGDATGDAFQMVSIRAGESTLYLRDGVQLVRTEAQRRARWLYSFDLSAVQRAHAEPAHAPEPWGTWLTSTSSEIVLPEALPARATLIIAANLLDPNVQNPVTVRLCGRNHQLRLTAALATYRVPYSCTEPPDRLVFERMVPLVPKVLGLSNDSRELSLALGAIGIELSPSKSEGGATANARGQ